MGFPLVIKPRFSHLWDGTRFLPDRGSSYAYDFDALESQVAERRQGRYWPILQRYVPGQGKGVFALAARGQVIAWFAHERLRDVRPTGSGSCLRRSIPLESRLKAPAERLLSAMKWHGPAMVEFRDDGASAPCLMEVNGRFWTSLQLAIDAGVDFPRLWLAILQGADAQRLSAQIATGYRENVVLRWLWGDIKRFVYILVGRPRGYRGAYPSVRQGLTELFGVQPAGTRLEIWRASDPWPALGEWVQGVREVLQAR
jgi:predicted ATP-grasp superfamily ATP-dependent carboligase